MTQRLSLPVPMMRGIRFFMLGGARSVHNSGHSLMCVSTSMILMPASNSRAVGLDLRNDVTFLLINYTPDGNRQPDTLRKPLLDVTGQRCSARPGYLRPAS